MFVRKTRKIGVESEEEASTRKALNKVTSKESRAKVVLIDEAVSSFSSKIKVGPEFV